MQLIDQFGLKAVENFGMVAIETNGLRHAMDIGRTNVEVFSRQSGADCSFYLFFRSAQ